MLVSPDQTTEREDVIAGYEQLWTLLSQHADADGDGVVSLEEFLGSVRDFFYSDDTESVGKYIFAGAS